MNPRLYAVLKSIAQVWLPALGTLVVTVQGIWGITQIDAAHIVATIVAVDTFLGAGLSVASVTGQSQDGHIIVTDPNIDNPKMTINIDTDLDKITKRNEIRLKVKPPGRPSTFVLNSPKQPDPPVSA